VGMVTPTRELQNLEGPMRSKSPMHFSRRRGARTRSGTPCQSPAMPNRRCRMHGGASPVAPKGNKNASSTGAIRLRHASSPKTGRRANPLRLPGEADRLFRCEAFASRRAYPRLLSPGFIEPCQRASITIPRKGREERVRKPLFPVKRSMAVPLNHPRV